MAENRKSPESPVPLERARDHAMAALRSNWAYGMRGFEQVGAGTLDKKPLIIHDLNGQELFYEFGVTEGDVNIGSVKASASKTLGSPVPQVQVSPRKWDSDEAENRALKELRKRLPKAKVNGTEFVCYGYPKIGVRAFIDDPGAGEASIIFDAASMNIVESYGLGARIRPFAWSFYNEIVGPYAERRAKHWDAEDKHLDLLRSEAPSLFSEGRVTREGANVRKELETLYSGKARVPRPVTTTLPIPPPVIQPPPPIHPIPVYSQRVIQYGPRCTTHDCYALYAQETDHHCAVASGQMLLDFYRYYYTQDEIGTSMKIGPGGCTIPNIVDGLKQRSMNCLNVTLDTNPQWSSAKGEIDQNRPLMSLIPGHARTCWGWKQANLWVANTPQPLWLFILDPWPWSADICKGGAIYWEDWYGLYPHGPKTAYIYLRHRTTSCQ